jgi:hypothetical protein
MEPADHSTYQILREAIVSRRSLRTNYGDYVRLFCPYMLGTDVEGDQAVVVFQFDGGQPGGLPSWGAWHAWKVALMSQIKPTPETWQCGELGNAPRLAMIDVVAGD